MRRRRLHAHVGTSDTHINTHVHNSRARADNSISLSRSKAAERLHIFRDWVDDVPVFKFKFPQSQTKSCRQHEVDISWKALWGVYTTQSCSPAVRWIKKGQPRFLCLLLPALYKYNTACRTRPWDTAWGLTFVLTNNHTGGSHIDSQRTHLQLSGMSPDVKN